MYKRVIGQKRLVIEVEAIIEKLRIGQNFNIIFSARSGMGKTHFVTAIANELDVSQFILYENPEKYTLDLDRRFHVFDEAHLLNKPELLYRYMDSQKYTFFLMTNFYGKLVEPVRNRCINLMLEPYSLEELGQIIFETVEITQSGAIYLANFSKGSPRLGKVLAKRLSYLAKGNRIEKENIDKYLEILGVNSQGIDENDKIYLTALKKAGGRASLNLLERLTGFDGEHIHEIEAYLISIGKIRIGSRGRFLL